MTRRRQVGNYVGELWDNTGDYMDITGNFLLGVLLLNSALFIILLYRMQDMKKLYITQTRHVEIAESSSALLGTATNAVLSISQDISTITTDITSLIEKQIEEGLVTVEAGKSYFIVLRNDSSVPENIRNATAHQIMEYFREHGAHVLVMYS